MLQDASLSHQQVEAVAECCSEKLGVHSRELGSTRILAQHYTCLMIDLIRMRPHFFVAQAPIETMAKVRVCRVLTLTSLEQESRMGLTKQVLL